MTIYIDVLLATNLAVNYFLLLAVSKVTRISLPLWRLLLGAAVGAIGSLYIFIPSPGIILGILSRPVFAAAIVFAAFGPRKIRIFLRIWAVFLGATLLFGGAMLGIYTIFKPRGMAIEGGVVYFDISPLLLVLSTSVCYCLLRLIQKLSELRHPNARRIELTLRLGQTTHRATAMVDTGHSLADPFTGAEVVMVSPHIANSLLPGSISAAKQSGRYRLIPCSTANGGGILEGIRIDSINIGGRQVATNPVAAVCASIGSDDYDAIIGPTILL